MTPGMPHRSFLCQLLPVSPTSDIRRARFEQVTISEELSSGLGPCLEEVQPGVQRSENSNELQEPESRIVLTCCRRDLVQRETQKNICCSYYLRASAWLVPCNCLGLDLADQIAVLTFRVRAPFFCSGSRLLTSSRLPTQQRHEYIGGS